VNVAVAIVPALLAAVVVALLWPEERDTAAGRTRAVFFALLAAAVGFALTSRQSARDDTGSTARAFQAYTEGLTNARAAVAFEWFASWADSAEQKGRQAPTSKAAPLRRNRSAPAPPPSRAPKPPAARAPERPTPPSPTAQAAELRKQALASYSHAVRLAPESTRFRREYGILLADSGHREEALRELRGAGSRAAGGRQASGERQKAQDAKPGSRSASAGLTPRSSRPPAPRVPAPASEAQLWERVYGPKPPSRADLPALEARLKQLRLGWFELLVRRSVYQRMGLPRQAEAVSNAAGRQAGLLVLGLFLLGFVMLGATVLGVGLLVGAFVNWRRGRFRPMPASFRAGSAPLLEAFVLYLFLYVTPILLQKAGVPIGPRDRSTALFLALLFSMDLLSLVAVAYLWRRLRASGLGLAEVGAHTRDWGRNIGFGIAAYIASLPLVWGSAYLSQWLGRRFFPEVEPPFHPIQAITAAAPGGWVRFAILAVVAVGAPLLEEFFFRGLLYGALRRRFGIAVGVLASAAVFSLLHPQLPLGFLPIFVLGAVFAAVYEWRQSLVPGMVMHALNNGFVWVALNLLFPPG
jgi:membrane protease YdiL (CAAX protease family)